jgi:putative copper export protein
MAVVVLPQGDGALDRRLTSWARFWVALLLVTSAGELVLRAWTMAGGGIAAGLAAAPAVLARTHFGTVWSARAGLLVLLLMLVGRSGRAARTVACGAALAVALTTALVGHAADRGDLSPIALIDWLHVTAATAWTGGLFLLAAVVFGEARTWPRARLLALLRRFSTLAGCCLAAVVASGMFNAWVELGSLDALWTTRYGAILIAKVLLVLAVASLGAANRFAVLPRLGAEAGPSGSVHDRLVRYVACEAGLALLVFGCTALLTESAPPGHHADMGRLARAASRCYSGDTRRP